MIGLDHRRGNIWGPDLTAAPMDPIALAAELENIETLARIVRFDRRNVVA